ncbi:phytanoyl-CoA dioxygenase family protein [Paraglaciecola arctica]|uniref:Phytanoyl-CoA dioxygenase n=1 Tax=Paraglaciecola arctica BSs20135 TaxID=493475 RepID=K6XHE5_9ALTE|nr:phytanoyl-CoA dioxygenase family protein [Paraglaciecola arctica]GAC20079.1 hypothetical protein GARC_3120 [Paraglaciecola arctica BSs20135]
MNLTKKLDNDGWVVFNQVINESTLVKLRTGLDVACVECQQIMEKNNIINSEEMAHHLPQPGNVFFDFILDYPLYKYIYAYFNGNFILHTFGGGKNIKSTATHAHNIHRDIRTFLPHRLMLNTMVLLDDFTLENGATHLLTGSHKIKETPSTAHFLKESYRVVAKAGSIVMFHSNLLHAAGENLTDEQRRAVNPVFTVPWKKPLFDYPRYLGYDVESELSEQGLQVFGYKSRLATSREEWYQPEEKRFYKSGQG